MRARSSREGKPSTLNVRPIYVVPNCLVDLSFSGEEMINGIQRINEWREMLYRKKSIPPDYGSYYHLSLHENLSAWTNGS
jgi:hypothetical protein